MELPATEDVANSEDDIIRTDTSLVSTDLLVLDQKGNAVPGLTAADFLIRENGVQQTAGHFLTGDNVNVPRAIVLIIDYSCTQSVYLESSIKGAKLLVDKLGPKDIMAIVTDDVEMIQDLTSDKGKLKHKLTQLYDRTRLDPVFWRTPGEARFGRNRQYSALMATLKEAFTVEDIRPIIIFQTGGIEAYVLRDPVVKLTIPEGLPADLLVLAERSRDLTRQELLNNPVPFSLDDIYRTVEKSRVTIYTVVPGPQYMGVKPEIQMEKIIAERRAMIGKMRYLSPTNEAHVRAMYLNPVQLKWEVEETAKVQSALAEVAPLTGGWTAFLEKPEQANEIYSRIFTDINQRYIVGYYPTNKKRDGKRRKIEFEVKGHPEYQVSGRRSYFAPGP
jgi:VWFA-related protein